MKHNRKNSTMRHAVNKHFERTELTKDNTNSELKRSQRQTKSKDANVSAFNVIPKKTLIFAMLIMLVFGFISTTFAAYFATAKDDTASGGSLIGSIRTAKIEKDNKDADISSVGANVDIVDVGANTTVSDGNGYLYFKFSGGDTWWNNTGCYHVAWIWGTGFSSQVARITKVGTDSNASTGNTTDVFNMKIPAGTITGMKVIRAKQDYAAGGTTYPGSVYNETGDITISSNIATYNLISSVKSGSGTITQNSRYVSIETDNPTATVTNAVSGSGTSSDPYMVKKGTSMSVSASASVWNTFFKVKYKYNNGSYTDSTTATVTASSSPNTSGNFNVTFTPCLGGTTTSGYTGTVATKTIYYKTLAEYTVSFNMNGHGTAPSSQTVTSGEKATKPSTDPSATGYTFGGWYKEADCTNAFNFDTAITKATTIYAKWTEKTATLTYNANGHGTAPDSVNMKYSTATNTAAALTAPGYAFTGWNTKADGTGTSYAAGAQFKAANVVPTNTTLYAQWIESYHTVTVISTNATGSFTAWQNFGGTETQKCTYTKTKGTTTFQIRDSADLYIQLNRDNTNQRIVSLTVNGTSKASNLNGNYSKTKVLSGVSDDVTIEYNVKNKPFIEVVKPDNVTASYTVTCVQDGVSKSYTVSPSTESHYYVDYGTTVTIVSNNATGYYISDVLGTTSSTGSYSSVYTSSTRPAPGSSMSYTKINFTSNYFIKSVQTANPAKPTLTLAYSTYKQGGNSITPTYSYSPSYDGNPAVTSVDQSFSCNQSGCSLNSSTGEFYSDTPGEYIITYTVTLHIVNGETVTATKTATINVLPATKYTVSFTAKSRDGVAGYSDNTALNSVLSGGGDVTEGNATTLIAPSEANADSKKWYFRGFMKDGGSLILGTIDGDNYKLNVTNVQSEQIYYAYYSTAPNATVPSYSTNVNSGDNFTLTVSNASGGSGTYYYTYSFVPYGIAENYQRSNSNTITVTKPNIGHYIFKLRIHSDEVDSTTSLRESYKQLVESQDIYVLHPSEEFTAQFTDPQGFTGDGTDGNPYRVGKDHNCTITITPKTGGQGTYYYKFGNNAYSETNTYTLPVATEGVGSRNITCSMYFVDSSGVQSAESSVTIYYYIYSTFAIVKGDVQRIYTDNQLSSLDIKAEAGDASDAYKVQFAMSSDGVNYVDKGEKLSFTNIDDRLLATFHVNDYLNDSGIAYFRAKFFENDTESGSDFVHTFIGATSTASTKNIYFKNNSGTAIDMTAYRLMACFRNAGGEQSWVTMQRVSDSETFRASVPIGYSDNVTFFIMDSSKYNTDYDNITDTFYLAKSAEQSLSTPLGDGKYMFTMNSITGTTINPANPAWAVYSN